MLHQDLKSEESVEDYSKHTMAVDWKSMGYKGVISSLRDSLVKGKLFLDYGCGPGFFPAFLEETYKIDIIGVDISKEMVIYCQKQYSSPNLTFKTVSNNKLTFIASNSMDAVISCYVLMQIPSFSELIEVAKEIHRVLKPGAKFVVLTMNPDYTGVQFEIIRNGEEGKHYQPGEKMITRLDTVEGQLVLEDIYWPKESYVSVFEKSGFQQIKSTGIRPERGKNADKEQFLVIEGVK
ncbi:class I SAM-dependent methyltransferase [Vibrio cholerae]|uniref:class I SAM-dependent methyltransferase n=1 Tax=Vibrio cholerae TaxID=666 RepID=UPI003966DA7D|nr:class I SAM-dependent methyltransferase [Vibrio cholerae]EJL6695836.1 class I SAM-dependent methyltransferase [Vibrio cholerae]